MGTVPAAVTWRALFRLPVALLIGLAAAVVSAIIRTALGLAGLHGRSRGPVIRAADIVNNVPLLPLLIFMVFVLGSQLWLILLLLVAFSWPGLTILIRSMVLGLDGSQEVRQRSWAPHTPDHPASRLPHRPVRVHAAHLLRRRSWRGRLFSWAWGPSLPTWADPRRLPDRAVFLGYCRWSHRACSSSSRR
jgi:peptide/nickel transport system permease protein